jgi:uncharacterized protein YukE
MSTLELEKLNKEYDLTLKQYNKAMNDYLSLLPNFTDASYNLSDASDNAFTKKINKKKTELLVKLDSINDQLIHIGKSIINTNQKTMPIYNNADKMAGIYEEGIHVSLKDLDTEKIRLKNMLKSIASMDEEGNDAKLTLESYYYKFGGLVILVIFCIALFAFVNTIKAADKGNPE